MNDEPYTDQVAGVDSLLELWKAGDVPDGIGIGPTRTVSVGGEAGKMFTYRAPTSTDNAYATYGFDAVAPHGGTLYTVSYQFADVQGDTCVGDAQTMLASFQFIDGKGTGRAPTATVDPLITINRSYAATSTAIDTKYNATATAIEKSYNATSTAIWSSSSSGSYSGGSSGGCQVNCTVSVSGYTRSNGTYVQPYVRAPPGQGGGHSSGHGGGGHGK